MAQHGLELRVVCLAIADNADWMIQKYRQKYRHIPFATLSKILFKGGGWAFLFLRLEVGHGMAIA